MITVFTVRVEITLPPTNPAHGFITARTFKFSDAFERERFLESVRASSHMKVIATNLDHIMNAAEALAECDEECRK
jgi:hypothetical protein